MKKNSLSKLTKKDIDAITLKASKKKNVPLIKIGQVNMRLDPIYVEKAKELASKCGEKYTTYIKNLVIEDIDRLWAVFKK